ncbi:hypothetical protein [Nocardia paucivorans]|uniref:hypothetical protein n=1 Tax=Nocardia paucivorans TaxID=114259 RepID=UPI0005930188|nr:hypothetical protein [Nocardia paucivorans]
MREQIDMDRAGKDTAPANGAPSRRFVGRTVPKLAVKSKRLGAILHPHLPVQVGRWVRPDRSGRDVILLEVTAAPCPRCPDCAGTGGGVSAGADPLADPDPWLCDRCARPLLTLHYPAWLDRRLPGSLSLLRRSARSARDTFPPF